MQEIPDVILSSTAKRARQTAELFAEELGYPKDKILFTGMLYHASDDEVLSELYGLNNETDSVMVVAHNPGLTDLVNNFTKDFIYNLPTSAVAKVVFHTDKWEKIGLSDFELQFILTPKMLENTR